MSLQLRMLIEELRKGAELSAEGATAMQWRERIRELPGITVSVHGLGVGMIADAARKLLLQRGQIRPHSDAALRGVLNELANILELERQALEDAKKPRADERREIPYYLKDSA